MRLVLFVLVLLLSMIASASNYEDNRKAGAAFLTENATKQGVIALPSNLQYKVLQAGDGNRHPRYTDSVTVHYRGSLIDGKVFDSSYNRGQPASFPLSRVVRGWSEGVQLMTVGAKYRLFLPSDLAYGKRGAGVDIPPGATLIFDIELLAIGP